MRIGLITSEFPPDLGGVETYAWQLACELGRRKELDVTVYAPRKSAEVAMPDGVSLRPIVTSCAALDWPRMRDQSIDVWHALSAGHSWIALRDRPTVVSVYGNDFLAPYPLTARPALQLPLLWRTQPWAWRVLAPYWRSRTRHLLDRALPRCATILACSRYTADALTRQVPECASLTKVAWVGVDPMFFKVDRVPGSGAPRLLTVARLSEPRKNIDLVLRALATLQAKHSFEYVVAGDGIDRGRLQALAISLGLSERVRFAGRVSDAELRQCYAKADLFVLTASISPQSHEGFGIVYLEAAAAGVPCLAARLAGAAEAVQEGKSGFFVDEPGVASLAAALDRFLSGELRFDRSDCQAFARQFTWSSVADIAVQSYEHAFVSKSRHE